MTSPNDRLDHERLARRMDDEAEQAEATERLSRNIHLNDVADTLKREAEDCRYIAALLRGAEAPRADIEKIMAHDEGCRASRTGPYGRCVCDRDERIRRALGGVSPRDQTTPSAEVLRDALRPLISREAVTDAALLNVADGLRDADFWGSPSPEAPRIYGNTLPDDAPAALRLTPEEMARLQVEQDEAGSVSSPTSTGQDEAASEATQPSGGDSYGPVVESPAPLAAAPLVEQSPSDPTSLGAASPTPKEGE